LWFEERERAAHLDALRIGPRPAIADGIKQVGLVKRA
jgi:hypothetical protein